MLTTRGTAVLTFSPKVRNFLWNYLAPFDLHAGADRIRKDIQLLDSHPGAGHSRVGETDLRDPLGQRLHEIHVPGAGRRADPVRHRLVADDVGQPVACGTRIPGAI